MRTTTDMQGKIVHFVKKNPTEAEPRLGNSGLRVISYITQILLAVPVLVNPAVNGVQRQLQPV